MKKNPYKVGDDVRLLSDVRDGYGDEWHGEGDVCSVERIAQDGEGLMFSSNMGIHFSLVEPVGPAKQRIELEQLLIASKKAAEAHPTGHGIF